MRRLRLSSTITRLCGVVEKSFHYILQLVVRLCLGENLANPSDVVLQEVFIQGMRHLQPVDERECRYVFTTVGDLGELALEEVDVRLEVVALSHLNIKKVVAILLGFSARGILSEKYFGYLLEVVERMR